MLDPFCGCGTTLAVAERLKRRWVGIDISVTAMGIIERRVLKERGNAATVIGMPSTEDELYALDPFEFQNWVIQSLQGHHSNRKTGDLGVDGYTFFTRDPIQVKRSHRVGRPVIDAFQTAVEREERSRGCVVAFSFTRGAHEEVARIKASKGIDIDLLTVREILIARGELRLPNISEIFQPRTGSGSGSFRDLPLPAARKKSQRPTADALIDSARSSRFAPGQRPLSPARQRIATVERIRRGG